MDLRNHSTVLLRLALLFTSPIFWPANSAIRWFYRFLFVPLMDLSLKLHLRTLDVALRLRHSSRGGTGFNAFLSDIDLSAYVPWDDEKYLSPTRNLVSRWKKHFPFVGELEIYTWDERRLIKGISLKHRRLYEHLRGIRKIGWLEADYRSAPSPYHAYKAVRALQLCLDKLIPGLKAVPAGNHILLNRSHSYLFPSEFQPALPPESDRKLCEGTGTCSPYLAVPLILSSQPQPKDWSLPPGPGLILLAISPIAVYPESSIQRAVTSLRQTDPEVTQAWRALSQLEWITVNAVIRGVDGERSWMPEMLNWSGSAFESSRRSG